MLQDANRLPPVEESLNRIIDAWLSDAHVALPAFVVAWDASKPGLVDAKPSLKRVYLNDDDTENPIEYPVIKDVPVCFPQSSAGSLTFPLFAGDPLWLVFSQRSLDAWKETDGKTPIDPGDSRRHHPTDAVAFLGPTTARGNLSLADGANVVLGVLNAALLMLGGKGLTSANGAARLSDLNALASVFNAHVHPHPFGPTSPPTTTQSPTASSIVLVK